MEANGEPSDDLAWWESRLRDSTLSPLTRDYPESTTDLKRPIEAVETFSVAPETRHAFSVLQEYGSATDVVLAAFVVLVARLTGDEDIVVGTNSAKGWPLVLRLAYTPTESFTTLISRVSQETHLCVQRPVKLDALQKQLKVPLLFRFAAFAGSNSIPTENVDLSLNYACSQGGTLQDLTAHYNQLLNSSKRIAGILGQLTQFLENAATNAHAAVGAIEFATISQKELMPDPTSDMKWSSFRGAIQDIFSRNAEAHPDRLCVVETASESSPERRFTYRQIHEASNTLAHHLVQSGVERGDVVMIYSYRGVDLVVAVMGILKAGGTFSVLDPQYPPDRQNIYLEVSKPRALVIIEKATQEAGPLHEKVRNFITENLALKTEVPALHIHDDGTLTGGPAGAEDLFESVVTLKSKSPGVVVGPDSTPTLSFTSGSEGRPKGVKGRHYSLAFYFGWMAEKFNLSANDKFTMLSGIAHDPIQRDMFTPLFLGAQLLVPSKNDIQNERLAEWMRDHGATVTHLTPAMGQILVGGASARFDKLHHAFFVGDILIKRDCRSLQALAPNVYIVNMYGTTETQRAVSYYQIPSRNETEGFLDGMKDVIPAGRGMYNVQMLVVNRFDRTKLCAVGEIGEIYVRASGLAEEYLGTPDLTKTKFVTNWFPGHEKGLDSDRQWFQQNVKEEPWAKYYFGPRDRLYRSGDLGRYTPSGDVECSGRADDQVKIRGFRIELGEIDTHLSQHPLVRENVTLVKRDKFEEQTLVSYVVPQIKEWVNFLKVRGLQDEEDDGSLPGRFNRFKPMQLDLQDYLRSKLPAYAVPSIIVPMRSMPLNPNGKVDKPKLPFPDTSMLTAVRRRKSSTMVKRSPTEDALADVWATILPGVVAKTIRPSDSFLELGGDSMVAQRLAFRMRRDLNADILIDRIYKRPTLSDMAAAVDQKRSADSLGTDHAQTDRAQIATNGVEVPTEYGADAEEMVKDLPSSFGAVTEISASPVVFLTGATGFLGAYVLRDLLQRKSPTIQKVYVLVRAKDQTEATTRIKSTCQAYGVWQSEWISRIYCITGNLGPARFGLESNAWEALAGEVDVVIHNGAQVHWINPYETLKAPNVLGALDAIKLCATGKPKKFAFVSSTSVLDHDHYVLESDRLVSQGGEGILESDDLSACRTGLTTGYGQSKWVAEYLVRQCGQRGLQGTIIRPGYVLGDSKSGVTNTDDFLIRMLKGCVQLQIRPNINNTVNMVPVDHVARTVVACAFNPPQRGVDVAHVTGHPRLRFNQYLSTLQTYGYTVPMEDYIPWTTELETYVTSHTDFALMPLFTFVANDLPTNTRAPELDDTNAEAALYADREWTGEDVSSGSGVTKNTIGLYLGYLVAIGFLPPPPVNAAGKLVKQLPRVQVQDDQKAALAKVGGRGATA